MLVVSLLMLTIGVVLVVTGPRSHNPPPIAIYYAVFGIAVVFGFVAFFSWMKEQGDGNDATGNNPNSES